MSIRGGMRRSPREEREGGMRCVSEVREREVISGFESGVSRVGCGGRERKGFGE